MVSTLRKKRPIVFFPKTFLKKTKTFAFEIFCSLYTLCGKSIQTSKKIVMLLYCFYIDFNIAWKKKISSELCSTGPVSCS